MSSPLWYSGNQLRSFPFLAGEPQDAGFPLEAVVDFGCMLGVASGFDTENDQVYLSRVARLDETLYFEFRCTASELAGTVLRFERSIRDGAYVTEFRDSTAPLDLSDIASGSLGSSLSQSASSEPSCEDDPLWEGFLVTGDLTALSDTVGVNSELLFTLEVEPSTCQNLGQGFLTSLNLANLDRTRATTPDECDELVFPYETGVVIVQQRCLQGELRLVAGYNAVLDQDNTQNLLLFSAAVGAGAGQPCNDLEIFSGEEPPSGRTTLDGGWVCSEVVRSINGVGGRNFTLQAGRGVGIEPNTAGNEVVVHVDMSGLAICYSESSELSLNP